ncbi:unnamed protein product [Wuchereria bancrofti]|uniref:Uncharacterized protein n=1 Tax=Wuchereria bancrofti TaxID=6293 RepID=A0A3P7G4Y7_WUCBA|nr:unnamed protein product [Wuchereria bancrofti]
MIRMICIYCTCQCHYYHHLLLLLLDDDYLFADVFV